MNESAVRRPAHRPSRRDDILVAGLVAFAERGPSAVTVADIAERAGMTPAAVYYHFPSKADLLLELVRQIGEEMDAVTTPRPESPRDMPGRLGEAFDDFSAWVQAFPDKARLFYATSPGVSPAIEAVRREWQATLTARVAADLRTRSPRADPVEADVAAIAIVTMYIEAATMRLRGELPAPMADPALLRAALVDLGLRISELWG